MDGNSDVISDDVNQNNAEGGSNENLGNIVLKNEQVKE